MSEVIGHDGGGGPNGSRPELAAARRLAPKAASLAAQIERDRALDAGLLAELRDGGLLRMCLPRSLGGGEVEPADMILALEELARGDGSVAWCAMIASTSTLLGAYLPESEAREVYDGGRAVCGGVFAPRGRGVPGSGGYAVTGRWPFASGVEHCDWMLGGCLIEGQDGPQMLEGGLADVHLMLIPRASVDVIDTWSVSGLRGTGSHDFATREELVPSARAVAIMRAAPQHDGRLYSFPLFGLLAVGIASVALGIARAAIDDLLELAGAKTPQGSSRPLAQRATVQSDVARAEASLRAARALMLDEAHAAWDAADQQPIPVERRLGLRLAATYAARSAAAVVDAMYDAGGGSSIYETSPLQRRFRDVHVATQHMMIAPATLELAGRLLLGLPSDTRGL